MGVCLKQALTLIYVTLRGKTPCGRHRSIEWSLMKEKSKKKGGVKRGLLGLLVVIRWLLVVERLVGLGLGLWYTMERLGPRNLDGINYLCTGGG